MIGFSGVSVQLAPYSIYLESSGGKLLLPKPRVFVNEFIHKSVLVVAKNDKHEHRRLVLEVSCKINSEKADRIIEPERIDVTLSPENLVVPKPLARLNINLSNYQGEGTYIYMLALLDAVNETVDYGTLTIGHSTS